MLHSPGQPTLQQVRVLAHKVLARCREFHAGGRLGVPRTVQGLLRWHLILLDELVASQAFEKLLLTGEYLAAGARASYSCWSHTF